MAEINHREEVKKVYQAEGWNVDNVARMSDRQVTALYLKFKSQGKLR